MNYGLYLSASGVLTNLYRQDVITNNLANVTTPGFKPDIPTIRQRDPESIEDGFGGDVSQRLLDRLGGGVLAGNQRMDMRVGEMRLTSNPLDLALEQANAFFVVRPEGAGSDPASIRLSRDGRLGMSADGKLIQTAGGALVLDENDQPIELDVNQTVMIDRQGHVIQGGAVVGKLGVAAAADTSRLVKAGDNLLRFEDGQDGRRKIETPGLKAGYVEDSGVDAIRELIKLTDITRAIEAGGNLIRYHDSLMDKAVNTLGRVVA
ncbi:MAG: flagellar hook-basal body complex protein [Phycisphaeraceae bacterium]|nr:flagellar hook-basal body complex protein [Phycisphaeraceae bacterium]